MCEVLPIGNTTSIPAGHLPCGNCQYAAHVDVTEIRRARFKQLMDERFDGKQSLLADALGMAPNYVSRILSGGKRLREVLTTRIEVVIGLERGWLSVDLEKTMDEDLLEIKPLWPFNFSRRLFDSLSQPQQKAVEKAVLAMIEAFAPETPKKQKRA